MWPSLLKIQYTEIRLFLYQSWPHDSPVEGEEPYLFWDIRSKVKVTVTINIIFDNSIVSKILFIVMVTLIFDPKINRVLPLPQGNHAAKFVKDPIYRTKVIVRKRSCLKNCSLDVKHQSINQSTFH
jgi:hypothetical protein